MLSAFTRTGPYNVGVGDLIFMDKRPPRCYPGHLKCNVFKTNRANNVVISSIGGMTVDIVNRILIHLARGEEKKAKAFYDEKKRLRKSKTFEEFRAQFNEVFPFVQQVSFCIPEHIAHDIMDKFITSSTSHAA